MWSTCSIETGQACTQAPQVTQSQTTSSVTAAGTKRRGLVVLPGALRVEQLRALLEDLVAQAHDQQLRRQRFARRERRAGVLAATALGAGEGVEHLLPGQVGDGAGAEPQLLVLDALLVECSGSRRPRARVRPNQTLTAAVAMCRCLECGR